MADARHLTRRQADVLAWLRERRRRGGPPPPEARRDPPRPSASLPGLAPQARAGPRRGRARRADARNAARGSPARGPGGGGGPPRRHDRRGPSDRGGGAARERRGSAFLRGDRPSFALRVRGDSMIGDGILDGDVVVVERREEARNGEIVVAGHRRGRGDAQALPGHRGPARRHRAPAREPAYAGPSLPAGSGARDGDGGGDGADAELPRYSSHPLTVSRSAGARVPAASRSPSAFRM